MDVSIDVFDSVSLNRVYQDVINVLTAHQDIEVSVLQALSYCFYEILDNVHTRAMTPAQREELQNSTAHYLEGALAPYHIPYTSIYQLISAVDAEDLPLLKDKVAELRLLVGDNPAPQS